MLDETEELMEELPFDEASFMARDLRENPEREYDFDGHRKQLEVYRKRVEEGIEILQEEKQCRERYDQRLAEVDRRREERDRAERERIQAEQLLEQKRSELTEQYYSWSRGNAELSLTDGVLQSLTRAVHQFDEILIIMKSGKRCAGKRMDGKTRSVKCCRLRDRSRRKSVRPWKQSRMSWNRFGIRRNWNRREVLRWKQTGNG